MISAEGPAQCYANSEVHFIFNSVDPEGEPTQVYVVKAPQGAIASLNTPSSMTIDWVPESDQTGLHDIVVAASDSVNETTTTLSVEVYSACDNPGNLPPSISQIPDQTIPIGKKSSVDVKVADPENGSTYVTIVTGPQWVAYDDGAKQVIFTPQNAGEANVTVEASDGCSIDLASFKVQAIDPNDVDGDGYEKAIDCDDSDKDVHPLNIGGNKIISSVTICAGVYKNTTVEISGKGISVNVSKGFPALVRLEGAGSNLMIEGLTNSHIGPFVVANSEGIRAADFHPYAQINIFSSSGNSFERISAEHGGQNVNTDAGIVFSSSSNNTIDFISAIDQGMGVFTNLSSHKNVSKSCTMNSNSKNVVDQGGDNVFCP